LSPNNHPQVQDKFPGILKISLKYFEGESMFMDLNLKETGKNDY